MNRVLFGTDFPMWDPGKELHSVRGLGLRPEELDKVLYKNAQAVLGL